MSTFNALDDFLNHGKRGGGGRLTGWKKIGHLNFVMSCVQLPTACWSHPFPHLWTSEDQQTKAKSSGWSMRDYVCWEDESILEKRFFRDKATGVREAPPEICPMCLLLEEVYQGIKSGDIDWMDVLFRFEGATDPKNNKVIRAGGFLNLFGAKKLTNEQLDQMKANNVYASESWKEASMPRCKYIVTLVDIEHPQNGLQIIDETTAVGDAIKTAINDTVIAFGGDKERGNPFKNPYAISLTYNETEPDPKKKYGARRIEYLAGGVPVHISPEIEKLIRGPAPSLARFTEPFNATTMLATMQHHINPELEMDWDRIFKRALEKKNAPAPAHAPTPASAQPATPTAAPAMDACPDCGHMCAADAPNCPKCGCEFEVPF